MVFADGDSGPLFTLMLQKRICRKYNQFSGVTKILLKSKKRLMEELKMRGVFVVKQKKNIMAKKN